MQQATARINIAYGPVRSGKTHALEILKWAEYVLTGPKGMLLMAGKTLKTLERNVLRPLRDVFGPSQIAWTLGSKKAHLFGREVELEGANDERAEDKITGMTLAGALTNELTLYPESFFRQLLARLSVPGARLFGTTNPDSPYHWLKADFLDREPELDLRAWLVRLEDNEHLAPEYVAALKKEYTGLWYKRLILGLWVQAAGSVYEMFDPERHVKTVARPFEGLFVDMDYGTQNPTTWSLKGFWFEEAETTDARGKKQRRRLPHVHTLQEYYHEGRTQGQKTDQAYVEELVAWLPERLGKVAVYLDPSAQSMKAALRARGFHVIEADNSVLDGIRFVSGMLADDRLTFDPSCKETLRQYLSYVWDEKAQKRGEDRPLKENDHACDRDRYGLYTRFARSTTPSGATINW